ncbi:MAG: hypothetical protein E6I08_04645 [Chloroflexi bacterium]|nr:MAG: hypothetical protein E6I08_04645 [Chloroflexota bacterium]
MDKREENTERELPDVKDEEIQQETGEELPDREAMSLVNANLALPINAAVAANVLSDGSVAYADAAQGNTIDQGNVTQNPLGG